MSRSHPIPDRDEVLRALRRLGPSTVTELMRDAGPETGARRHYRQLLRTMIRQGDLLLDRKGRLSIPKSEIVIDSEDRFAGRRGRKRESAAAGAASRSPAQQPARSRDVRRAGRTAESRFHDRKDHAGGEARPHTRGGDRRAIARFDGHARGFGFVNPTDGSRDVFIPPHRTGGAMHGDLVEYRVDEVKPDGRREGSVVRIAGARGQRVVGLVTATSPEVLIVPFDARSGARFRLATPHAEGLDEGVAVVLEVSRPAGAAPAHLVEVLGPIDRPGVDIEVLIRKHGIRAEFPENVVREAEALSAEIPDAERAAREDFTHRTVVTIDGETAKDFDDAISVARAAGGGYELAVHIADVAHFVRPGSAIDIEARLRGTSTYFPGRAVPMLPPALSENICSLRPGVPRLVQTVVIRFGKDGAPQGARFADGVIKSRARLTYGRVNALFHGAPPDGPLETALLTDLRLMRELALLLADRRAARGGLDFDLPEPEVVLDALGAAAGVRPASRGPAQRLIEEFMIGANIAVAEHLVRTETAALHRVHERPDPAKVGEFARTAAAFGFEFAADPDETEPSDFRDLLDRIAGHAEERILGKLLLRTMALARYAPEPLGHFGLAAPEYLHFTSPIRRYPDLVAHRALRIARAAGEPAAGRKGKGAKGAKGPRGSQREEPRAVEEDLTFLGAECSRLERGAEGAERESLAWKRAEVLKGRLGDEMDGTVSSVAAQGLFVELDEVFAEGLIPVGGLPADRYVLDPVRLALHGQSGGRSFRAGQRVRVVVARVDRIAQRVELAFAAEAAPKAGEGAAHAGESGRSRARLARGAPKKREPRRGRTPGRKPR